jgi:hypothetical protein
LAFLAGEPYAQYLAQPLFAGAQVPGPLWTLYWSALYLLGGESVSNSILYSAVFNSLVVYLVYRLARNFVGDSYALMTALLFAVLPWPIYHAAGLWNPTVLPLLGALLALAMWHSCSQAHSRSIFFVCLLLAVIPQFHMIGIFYLPVAAALLLLLSPSLNWRWLMIGMVAGFSLYLPYLIGEMQHGWSNAQKLFSEDTGFSWGWLKILTSPPSLLASVPISVTPDDTQAIKALGDRFFGSYFILLAISLLSLLAAIVLYFSYMKRFVTALLVLVKQRREAIDTHRETLFLGGLIFLPLIFFAVTGHGYASRYALLIMPLLFLLPAIFIQRSESRKLKRVLPAVLSFVVIFSSYLSLVTYHYKSELLTDSAMLMPSFSKLERISAQVNEDAGERSRARIQFSQAVQRQTGRYHKVYGVFPLYVELDQRYKYVKTDGLPSRRYTLRLADEKLPPKAMVIYRDRSVVITRSVKGKDKG